MTDVLLGFGGNEGDVPQAFADGLAWWKKRPCVQSVRASSLRTYPAAGCEPKAATFQNGVVRLTVTDETSPDVFFAHVMERDRKNKPEKTERWHSRLADWDLLLFGDRVIHDWPRLILPHPMLPWRRFVLEPAMEIAADMVHPTTGRTLEQLLNGLDSGTCEWDVNFASQEDASRRQNAQKRGVPYLDCRDVWRAEENIPVREIVGLALEAYRDDTTRF